MVNWLMRNKYLTLDLFKQCCEGEYPRYTLTEKGREYAERLRNK